MANPVYITRNGTDISNSVNWKDVDMISVLTKEVSTLTFSVSMGVGQTFPAISVPVVGDVIKMYDSTGIIFGGTCTETETTIEGLMTKTTVTCTDWSYIFDGVLVKKNYAAMDPHDIVVDLVATFCAGKGFTTNHVQVAGFLVPSIKFNYQQPTKSLESLAKLIGWDWYIDPNKDVHFFLGDVEDAIGEGGEAPISIDATTGGIQWNTLDVDLNLTNMQNSVFVIGGNYSKTFTSANTPDNYPTDGTTSVWSTSYPYTTSTVTVTLDGAPQSVGIAGQVTTGVDVLYSDSNRNIQFINPSTGAPLAPGSGHTIKVFGQAQVPIIAHAGDAVSIGLYGEYQSVISDTKITTVAEAQARANAAILQFGHPVFDIKVTTLTPGCAIGQAIPVNLPAPFSIDKQLVIKRVEATVLAPGANGQLAYQLECIGSDNVTFVDLMSTLLQEQATQTTVDDSTVNENLIISPPEALTLLDALTATPVTHVAFKWGASANNSKWGFSTWQ